MKRQRHIKSIDYYAYRSPLRRLNPGFKLLFVSGVMSLCLIADHPLVSVYVILSLGWLNTVGGSVALREYGALMALPLVFVITGCIAIAVEIGYSGHGWVLRVTYDGVFKSLKVMLRTIGCVTALYFLTLSTPVHEIVSVLKKLHVPGVFTELMSLIYRYIFILLDTQQKIRCSAESRLGYSDFKQSCVTFGKSMGNLLVISLKRAGSCYDAMESRCYDGELLFLEEEKKIQLHHVAGAVLYLAVPIAALIHIK